MQSTEVTTGKAIKFDAQKPKLMKFIVPEAIEAITRTFELGAKKYGDYNWKSGDFEYTRLLDAAMRHLMAFRSGEDIDPDSGLQHLAHLGANVHMLLWYTKHHPEMDDRFGPPGTKPEERQNTENRVTN